LRFRNLNIQQKVDTSEDKKVKFNIVFVFYELI